MANKYLNDGDYVFSTIKEAKQLFKDISLAESGKESSSSRNLGSMFAQYTRDFGKIVDMETGLDDLGAELDKARVMTDPKKRAEKESQIIEQIKSQIKIISDKVTSILTRISALTESTSIPAENKPSVIRIRNKLSSAINDFRFDWK